MSKKSCLQEHCLNLPGFCLTDSDNLMSFVLIFKDILIFKRYAAQEFMTPEFKKQWFRKKAHEIPADAELISCMPLSLILEMFGISQIDFFSLDVEVILSKQRVLKEAPMSSRYMPYTRASTYT